MTNLLIPNTCQVPNVLLDEIMPTLSGSSLKVLLAIVRKTYGFQKRSDKISFRTLQELTGLSRGAVNQGIKGLGSLAIITPGARGVHKLEGVNEYALNLDVETGTLVRYENRTGTKIIPERSGIKNDHAQVRKVDSSKPNSSKPNKDILAESAKPIPMSVFSSRRKKATQPDPAQIRAFEAWYSAYPRHVGKKPALQAWLKLNPDQALLETIVTATGLYMSLNEGVEDHFILHPATWLNQERWTDEAPISNVQQSQPRGDLRYGDG